MLDVGVADTIEAMAAMIELHVHLKGTVARNAPEGARWPA
jgi:hypothetical protein